MFFKSAPGGRSSLGFFKAKNKGNQMETNLPILRPKKMLHFFLNLFLVIVLEVKERYLQIF